MIVQNLVYSEYIFKNVVCYFKDVNILKKKDGKMVGCAFVQFSSVAEAR